MYLQLFWFLVITFANVDQFSKSFHWQISDEALCSCDRDLHGVELFHCRWILSVAEYGTILDMKINRKSSNFNQLPVSNAVDAGYLPAA